MIIIADSGSTKTKWCLIQRDTGEARFVQTAGINPFYQNGEEILHTLENEFREKPASVEELWFYGAGCANPDVNRIVVEALKSHFSPAFTSVESDLMAAARSLCRHEEGIACILGTGSNSCYYDGNSIIKSVSPLGFILGDEGSGGVLGKRLLADVLKNQLPPSLIRSFWEFTGTTQAAIMENIYRKPFPNRYAAGFTRFILAHVKDSSIRKLVSSEFDAFFLRNVLQLPKATEVAVHFTGSIAFHFSDILTESAGKHRLRVGRILQEPM